MSHEQGLARTRDRCLQVFDVLLFLSSSFYIENMFSIVSYACVHVHVQSVILVQSGFVGFFPSLTRLVLLNLQKKKKKNPFSVGHSTVTVCVTRSLWSSRNLTETWKSPSHDSSRILWQISKVGLWFTI